LCPLERPSEAARWSLTTLCETLVKIGDRIVRNGRDVVFQLAEVAVPRKVAIRWASSIVRVSQWLPRDGEPWSTGATAG
jgi:hypothetical protein